MDCKFSNRENTKYTCILCGNHFYNVCTVPADESHEGYHEQRYYFGKCPNGACERFKDKSICDSSTVLSCNFVIFK